MIHFLKPTPTLITYNHPVLCTQVDEKKLADFDDWGQSTRRLDGGEQKITDDEGTDGSGSCPAVERIVIALFRHSALNIEPFKEMKDQRKIAQLLFAFTIAVFFVLLCLL